MRRGRRPSSSSSLRRGGAKKLRARAARAATRGESERRSRASEREGGGRYGDEGDEGVPPHASAATPWKARGAAPPAPAMRKMHCASIAGEDGASGAMVTREQLVGLCELLNADLRPYGPLPSFDDLCAALRPYRAVFRKLETTRARMRAVLSDAALVARHAAVNGMWGGLAGGGFVTLYNTHKNWPLAKFENLGRENRKRIGQSAYAGAVGGGVTAAGLATLEELHAAWARRRREARARAYLANATAPPQEGGEAMTG